jgi:glycosyltransferase involved in cell wall biosynthesis
VPENLISIVLPIRNQADHVREIVEQYSGAMARVGRPFEVILVINASRDRSQEICEQLARENASIVTLVSERGGWGLAVRMGLQAARGDLLCYTNAARTAPGDLVLSLLYAMAFPDVVVKANRKIRASWRRRLGSLLYNLECRALFDLPNWDINGTPKVFPRQFGGLLALTRDDDLIDLEFSVICREQNYPMVEVPIFSSRRHGGKSTTTYVSALRMYWGAYELRRRPAGSPLS